MAWLEKYRRLWEARFAVLDEIVEELTLKEKIHVRKKHK
jgi:hypothetical protein